MIEQILFHEEHINQMTPIDSITEDIVKEVVASPCAWTILSDGVPVCIWGKVHVWNGRAIIWALMGEGSRSCMKQLIECGRETIDRMDEQRIEATVRVGFPAGVRFIELLGFARECVMEKFSSDGDAEYLYARVT